MLELICRYSLYFEDGEPPVLLVGSRKCKATLKGLVVEALTVETKAWCGVINMK